MGSDPKRKARKLLTVADFERAAKQRLTRAAYDYFRSGSEHEHALSRNDAAFDDYVVWFKVLVDVAERQLGTTVLGTTVATPILIAPTAYHRLAHPDGELATA